MSAILKQVRGATHIAQLLPQVCASKLARPHGKACRAEPCEPSTPGPWSRSFLHGAASGASSQALLHLCMSGWQL